MHTYTAALRLAGERLNIQQINQLLGLEPTRTVNVGEPQQGGPSTQAVWLFEASSGDGGREWHSLEDALSELLTRIWPQRDAIQDLLSDYDTCLWCGHFTSSFDGGPHLSAVLLHRLADLGVPLFLDTYCSQR